MKARAISREDIRRQTDLSNFLRETFASIFVPRLITSKSLITSFFLYWTLNQ